MGINSHMHCCKSNKYIDDDDQNKTKKVRKFIAVGNFDKHPNNDFCSAKYSALRKITW